MIEVEEEQEILKIFIWNGQFKRKFVNWIICVDDFLCIFGLLSVIYANLILIYIIPPDYNLVPKNTLKPLLTVTIFKTRMPNPSELLLSA